jgi:hypothetical protein
MPVKKFLGRVTVAACAVLVLFAGLARGSAQEEAANRVRPAMATIFVRGDRATFDAVGSGMFVRSDGVLLTAYDLVRDAREIQVRLASGEVYDKVAIVAFDQRRNVAVLRVPAMDTPFVQIGAIDESVIGMRVYAVYNLAAQGAVESVGVVSAISLADEIPGAGTGFRILKFTQSPGPSSSGGVIIDAYGHALALMAPSLQAESRSYALPIHHIAGMIRAVDTATQLLISTPGVREMNRAVPASQTSTTPLAAMPQVAVPQRPTSPLQPAGPGSEVLKVTDPGKLLMSSKTVYIISNSNVFKSVQLLNELKKKNEFSAWNLTFVDDSGVADLVLEIEHIPMTWEFPFSIRHQRSGVVIAAGKVYAWGGGDGALLMATRVVERLTKLRAGVKTEPEPASKTGVNK